MVVIVARCYLVEAAAFHNLYEYSYVFLANVFSRIIAASRT